MIYCINPTCQDRANPDEREFCDNCGTDLIINERYRLVKPLRQLERGQHIEVFEVDNSGETKVIKVLISQQRRLIDLLHQEAKILRSLAHLNVPQVDTNFTFFLPINGKKIHCLVMEKVPGENLERWLEKNGVISEAMAVNWLSQLSKFLTQIHKEEILHRDIKPSNIILRPDGKLILIDFGTARQITSTYIEKLPAANLTRVYTSGYTAPEQLQGQAVCKSDFFALGCTLVYLLTGKHPDELPKDENDRLIWRDLAPHISPELADLIDRLILPLPDERLHTPQLFLEHLQRNPKPSAKAPITSSNKTRSFKERIARLSSFWKVVAIASAVALVIIGVALLSK